VRAALCYSGAATWPEVARAWAERGVEVFTGIVTAVGEVRALLPIGDGRDMRLTIAAPWQDTASIPLGASVACAGCCLTAVAAGADWFAVDVSAETLARTRLGTWREGTRLNLERSLRVGDELGGHIVSGHVDGLATVAEMRPENGSYRVTFELPPGLARYVAEKGSVAVDGVSLTVNQVEGRRFGVNVIPHTWSATTLGLLQPGGQAHIEVDMLARYVARLAETSSLEMQ
jgi:riboflavin synthase